MELPLSAFFDHPTLEAPAREGGSLEDILAALEGLSLEDARALPGAAEGA